LGILGLFKYWGFFVDSAASALASLGLEPGISTLRIVLPVGISFYTFQTLSYTIDIYRRQLEPEPSLARFALFVSFFPQLVAGPIERARQLLPQLRAFPDSVREIDWSGAAYLILRGLFRKVVIADGVAPLVNEVYANPSFFGGVTVGLAVLGFSLQIYGDFAGYTDIARGVAKLFGVDLMVNFRTPYRAKSFRDFWRRWHISLSTWLRDYLYIPLGGNRLGTKRTYLNLMVTMLLGGFWHGAGWGFVIWGGLHGTYLVIEVWWTQRRKTHRTAILPSWFVFIVVTLTWIPFRSPSFAVASDIAESLVHLRGPAIGIAPVVIGLLGIATMVLDDFDAKGVVNPAATLRPFGQGLVYGTGILAAFLFASQTSIPFIYFQF
jgi:D-alanyl-lipoteichoic acid acyltransferase DltB (MBOAT superfamily)